MTFYFECLRRSLATIPFQLMHSEILKKNLEIQRKSYIRSSSADQDGITDPEMLCDKMFVDQGFQGPFFFKAVIHRI